MANRISITPLSDSIFGATVEGVRDLKVVDKETFSAIHDASHEHRLLVLKELGPSDAEHVEFAAQFGELNRYYLNQLADSPHPELLVLTNDPELEPYAGTEALPWHTNCSYQHRVAKFAIAHVPTAVPSSAGGSTIWTDTVAAFDALDTDVKRVVEGLKIHQSHHAPDRGGDATSNVLHDAVRETNGRKALYEVGDVFPVEGTRAGRGKSFPALPESESKSLLAVLLAAAARPEFQYRHEWSAGDIIIWDNFSTMHMREAVIDTQLVRTIKVADVLEDRPSGLSPSRPASRSAMYH